MNGIDIIERIAETGTAPKDGCSLFGVGYEDAFDRIEKVYLERRFSRGGSAEKFVIGPYGAGKTHFIRQLMEIARNRGCVTAEVALNKDVDFVQNLVVYREVAREIRPPGVSETGIPALLDAAIEQVRAKAPNEDVAEQLVRGWVEGIDGSQLKLEPFGRMLRRALEARLRNERGSFAAYCRWLSGEVHDRVLAKELGESPVSKSEHNVFARRALLSLFQFIRSSGFPGTLVTFDEAEQGFNVPRRKMQQILSMLQSDINAIADLDGGAALIVYALTPDITEHMEDFAALAQRVADPGPTQGFFDGNTRAPKIDLTLRDDPVAELSKMAQGLVKLLFKEEGDRLPVSQADVVAVIEELAHRVADEDPSTSNRRTMMKRSATLLLRLAEEGVLEIPKDTPPDPSQSEDEV